MTTKQNRLVALLGHLLNVANNLFNPRQQAQQQVVAAILTVNQTWDTLDDYLRGRLPGGIPALLDEYHRRAPALREAEAALKQHRYEPHLGEWTRQPLDRIWQLRELISILTNVKSMQH